VFRPHGGGLVYLRLSGRNIHCYGRDCDCDGDADAALREKAATFIVAAGSWHGRERAILSDLSLYLAHQLGQTNAPRLSAVALGSLASNSAPYLAVIKLLATGQ
jgi:hypothetical protein